MPRFVGEKIAVETKGAIREPVAFTWRGDEYRIAGVIVSWFDWGFPAGSAQRDWRTRRHRNYFRVRTESHELFEIYLDRATPTGSSDWYLFQKLDPEQTPGGNSVG